jgi:hypothetical protein
MKADNNYLLQGIPRKNPNCKLPLFMRALDFIRENESFRTVDLQRFLHTAGYGKVIKVIDALLALGIIEIADEKERPIRYVRAVIPEQLDVNVFYNGRVEENGDENKSGWDPSLFKNKEDCLAYLKSHYGNDFISPVYTIDTVHVGSGWELVDQEIIYDISLQKENSDELH